MKTFARFAAIALVASSAFSGTSFARSTTAPTASVASDPHGKGPESPIPTCVPGTGCTFPVGR